jgi:osmoprotectant transport system ATP-binding protein
MPKTAIKFQAVSKHFADASYPAVDNVTLTINEGEFITVLGSSGSGKTTLLKMVNRLYDCDGGKIELFDEDIATVDAVALRRRIGYVVQHIGLFPHMTVAENIATVPKLLNWSKEAIVARVDELLTTVGLDPEEFKSRYPKQLSGGQQQRVGLARALAVNPKIMLLDEPFGALDAITRLNLQNELLKIHGGLKKTFLFVTHDINEAFKLGNRVIIMNEGNVCQFDTPKNIMNMPADAFVKELIDAARGQESFWGERA